MPYEGEVPLTPAELVARGLLPPGPLAPAVIPGAPAQSEEAIKNALFPPQSLEPRVLGRQPLPLAKPGDRPAQLPAFFQMARKHYPDIAGMLAAMQFPGGPLGRTVAGAGASGLMAMLQGQSPFGAAARTGASQAAGEAVGGLTKAALNSPLYRRFAQESAEKLANWLKQQVPAWAQYPAGEGGLTRMLSIEGQTTLSREYDKYLTSLVETARGRNISLSLEDALKLDLPTITKVQGMEGPQLSVLVDAGAAARAITGMWTKDPTLYRRVVGALDDANIGDPAMRAAYKYGSGFRDFAFRKKIMEGESYRPERAMQGLLEEKPQAALRRRGMTEAADIIRGPGEKPVERQTLGWFERHAPAWIFGPALGYATGHPVIGGAVGLGAAELMPRQFYRNVPLSQGAQQFFQKGPAAGAEALRLQFPPLELDST